MKLLKSDPSSLCMEFLMLCAIAILSSHCVHSAFTFTFPHEPLVPLAAISPSSSSPSTSRRHIRAHSMLARQGLFHGGLVEGTSYSSSNIQTTTVRQSSLSTHTRSRTHTTRLQATMSITNPTVPPKVNAILVISSIAILVGYHLNLFRKEFKSENSSSSTGTSKTWRQYQADTREDWARHVREMEGWLYAIQSLRNAITAQTFLATTVLSLLTLITGRMWDILRSASVSLSERRLLTIQLSSIALTMLVSAYQFLQGVRLMTHAGFMFPVKKNDTKVDNIMRQTQNCQWLGLRWMYISLGPISWAVGGSRAFFITALTLLQFFRSIDKKPEGLGYEEFQGASI